MSFWAAYKASWIIAEAFIALSALTYGIYQIKRHNIKRRNSIKASKIISSSVISANKVSNKVIINGNDNLVIAAAKEYSAKAEKPCTDNGDKGGNGGYGYTIPLRVAFDKIVQPAINEADVYKEAVQNCSYSYVSNGGQGYNGGGGGGVTSGRYYHS